MVPQRREQHLPRKRHTVELAKQSLFYHLYHESATLEENWRSAVSSTCTPRVFSEGWAAPASNNTEA
jgi:hypothetical protein